MSTLQFRLLSLINVCLQNEKNIKSHVSLTEEPESRASLIPAPRCIP